MSSIVLRDVCLDYVVKTGVDSLKKTVIHLLNYCVPTNRKSKISISNTTYRALTNINLNIQKGDRIGLLGRNGAGKSTLLRVLAKVYRPNIGDIEVNGKISTLFDVNLGMNVEATGYENIVNLAVMRGNSKKDAQEMIEDIETFTELGEFFNHPVRTYSMGMQMKLAFAVATSVEPEIMLIDEVIGAGDFHFLNKARKRIQDMIDKSHILVLTSHSPEIIRQFCNKVVVLDKGEIRFMGDVKEGIELYQSS